MNFRLSSLVAAAVLLGATAAHATLIPDGTVSSQDLFSPTVDLSVNPSTYSSIAGGTFQVTATGGFAGAAGHTGTMSGTITFSDTAGVTLADALTNLFVFDDGAGGTFNFSATSVLTRTFANTPGVSSSFTLYLLGTTADTNFNETATLTSLTLSANSTGGSAYSSSATLAVPPAPVNATPEPSSLVLMGTGILGLAGAVRRKLVK